MLHKIRLLGALLIALALLGTGTFSTTQHVHAQGTVPDATVATSLLRIRVSPNRRAAVIATVPKGTAISLDGRVKFSAWVHGTTASGITGWMSRPYLAIRNDLKVDSLPILTGAPVSTPLGAPNALTPVSGRLSGGFELGGQVTGLDGAAVNAMHRAKMSWVKFQVGVGDNTGAVDIGVGHAAGFKVLLSVKGDKNSVLNPGYFSQYAGYVGTLAEQGADAIEVWNEANLDREWPNGQINPATYTQLLAQAFSTIKRVHPGTIVISGAPSPTGAGVTAAYWNDDVFYAGMAKAGAANFADCIGIHYNEGIVAPNQTSGGWINYPTNYFDTMLNRALASFPGKKGCFTELGYLTPEGFPGIPGGFAWARNTTVAEQAAWLAQAAVRASASGRVRLMIVWNVNATFYGDDPQAGFAMIRPGGACPACDSLGGISH